jgi:vitamin B12 transporter
MQKTLYSSLLLASVSASLTAHAANNDEILPEMLVTATRSDTARNELASAATVYTREDIERLQVRTLPDLLKGSTGVDVVQQGGYGQLSSVSIRGTNSNHILVLIDGIKAGSVSAGTTAFELIPIEQIERVEIIRGPQSSLYGSEAIGGVIQIFTRKGAQTEKPSVSVEAGGGSYDTHREAGNISGRWQKSWYNLGVSNIESNGFSALSTPADPDRDGYRNTAVNARVGHRFDNSAEVEAFFMRAEGVNRFDNGKPKDSQCDVSDPLSYCPNQKQFVSQVVGTSLSKYLRENWQSTLRLGQTRDEGTYIFPTGSFESSLNTSRWNVSWLNEIKVSDNHRATLGADYRVDEVDGSDKVKFDKTSRYDVGVFGEIHSRLFDNHFLNASLRWDKNQAFGDYVTGNIGWRFNWLHGLSAFANFGNAFKAPTFNDLYRPDWGGNPNLKAEQSSNVEVGFGGDHGWGKWELRAYHTDIDNLIAFGSTRMENINKAQIDGIEAEIATEVLGWNHKLTGNLLSPRDRIKNTRLNRRADKTLSYDVSKKLGAFDLGATVLAQSDRPDIDYFTWEPTKVAGFVTLDFRTAYHIDKNWMISGKLNNILDKHYQTVSNYNMADRTS